MVEAIEKFEVFPYLQGLSAHVEAAVEAATSRNFQEVVNLGWEALPPSTPEEIEEEGDFTYFSKRLTLGECEFDSTISVENPNSCTVWVHFSIYAPNTPHMNFSVTRLGSYNTKVEFTLW